ncbi:MAG: I78 family peptidase inhibitor [Oceanicaulis sp.]
MTRCLAAMVLAALLAGCQTLPPPASDVSGEPVIAGERGPDVGDGPMIEDGSPSCPAAAYQVLVGQRIGEIHTESLPSPHRVYGRSDMITMDYRPERLNVVTGDDGAVIEVKCG